MPPVAPNPVGDLARIYRARIPTPVRQGGRSDKYGFGQATPIPGTTSSNPIGRLASGLRSVVESLDPRVVAREGGRSVQHVVGDVGELAKSVVTGKDTLSQSPSARAYQAAGGGVSGAVAATLPYVNVGTAILPTTRALTPAGRAGMTADIANRVAQRAIASTRTAPLKKEVASPIQQLAELMSKPEMASILQSDDMLKAATNMRPQQKIQEKRLAEMTGSLLDRIEGMPLSTPIDWTDAENKLKGYYGQEIMDFLESGGFRPLQINDYSAEWQSWQPVVDVVNDQFALQFNPRENFVDIRRITPNWAGKDLFDLPYLDQIYGQDFLNKLKQALVRYSNPR